MQRRYLLAGLAGLAASSAKAGPPAPLRVTCGTHYAISWVTAQLLARVYAQAGLPMDIVPQPTARATASIEQGLTDGECARIAPYGLQHPSLLRLEPPIYALSAQAFWLSGRKLPLQRREDLANFSLVYMRGVHYAEELAKGLSRATATTSPEQMFRMLAARRVEVVVDAALSAQQCAKQLQLDIEESPVLLRYEVYHFLHPRHAALVPRLSEALRQLIASGELKRLTAQLERDVIDRPLPRLD